MTVMMGSSISFAEEPVKEPEPTATESTAFEYSPDFCEFSVKFPEEPYKTKRCDGENETKCYELTSFTQVFLMRATVNFRVICNPLDPSVYEKFSPQVMETTLKAMTAGTIAKTFNSDYSEDEQKRFKQAGLVGEGVVGQTPAIYIAQMWLGKQSALTVQAELIGEADDEADKLYSDILKTIQYSGVKTKTEEKN
jgi:hypothetical protein